MTNRNNDDWEDSAMYDAMERRQLAEAGIASNVDDPFRSSEAEAHYRYYYIHLNNFGEDKADERRNIIRTARKELKPEEFDEFFHRTLLLDMDNRLWGPIVKE